MEHSHNEEAWELLSPLSRPASTASISGTSIPGSPGLPNPGLQSGYVYLQGQYSAVPSPAPSPAPVEADSTSASPRYQQHPDLPDQHASSALNLTPPRMSLDDSVSGHHTGTYGQPPPHAAFASKGSPSDNDSLVHVVITPSPASSPKPLKVQLTPATSATSGGGVGGKAAAGGEQAGLASPRKPHDLDAAITKSPKLGKEQQYEAISPSAEDQPAEQLRPATQSYAAKDKEAHQTEQAASGAHHHAPNPASAPRGLLARLVTSLGVPLTLLGTLLVVVAATHLIVHVRSRQAHITSGSSQSRASGGDTVAPTSPQHGGGRGRAQAVY